MSTTGTAPNVKPPDDKYDPYVHWTETRKVLNDWIERHPESLRLRLEGTQAWSNAPNAAALMFHAVYHHRFLDPEVRFLYDEIQEACRTIDDPLVMVQRLNPKAWAKHTEALEAKRAK